MSIARFSKIPRGPCEPVAPALMNETDAADPQVEVEYIINRIFAHHSTHEGLQYHDR